MLNIYKITLKSSVEKGIEFFSEVFSPRGIFNPLPPEFRKNSFNPL